MYPPLVQQTRCCHNIAKLHIFFANFYAWRGVGANCSLCPGCPMGKGRPWAQPTSFIMGIRSLPGTKLRGVVLTTYPHSSAEVKERVDYFLYSLSLSLSLSGLSCSVVEQTLHNMMQYKCRFAKK
jgi:hypothetical protein